MIYQVYPPLYRKHCAHSCFFHSSPGFGINFDSEIFMPKRWGGYKLLLRTPTNAVLYPWQHKELYQKFGMFARIYGQIRRRRQRTLVVMVPTTMTKTHIDPALDQLFMYLKINRCERRVDAIDRAAQTRARLAAQARARLAAHGQRESDDDRSVNTPDDRSVNSPTDDRSVNSPTHSPDDEEPDPDDEEPDPEPKRQRTNDEEPPGVQTTKTKGKSRLSMFTVAVWAMRLKKLMRPIPGLPKYRPKQR